MADMTRGELNDLLAGFAAQNPKYKESLIKDPKGTIEKQLNNTLPGSLKVKVIEDSPDVMHIVLPHVPAEGEELSDADLEAVAGGFLDKYTCNFKGAGAAVIGTRVSVL